MFQRYNGAARRALFFARHEVSELGSRSIETEHLLIGMLCAAKGSTARIFADAQLTLDAVRTEVQRRGPAGEKIPTTVEIPFSEETKRILRSAPDQADDLGDDFVGIEHLVLSILQEPATAGARMLLSRGVTSSRVQQAIVQFRRESAET